jgi:hypothetical protein
MWKYNIDNMRSTLTKIVFVLLATVAATIVKAQKIQDGKLWLNEDGSNYFKVTLISQVWVRNTDMNPGTTINGYAKDNYTDMRIRRARLQAYGQISRPGYSLWLQRYSS